MTMAETEAETPGPRRSITGLFGTIGRFVIDVILPPTCLACRTPVGEGGGFAHNAGSARGLSSGPIASGSARRSRAIMAAH
jgi:hypothetical protein